MGIDSFNKTARRLSRNPLGIIALFIVLVYGIAALVFGLSSQHLEAAHKTLLIWFLIIFPVIVLSVFAWLVSKHHTKLYSPSDFREDQAFLQILNIQDHRRRLDDEVEEISTIPGDISIGPPDKEIPEKVLLARKSDIRSSIILAEDLVLRVIEQEQGAPIRRHVRLQGKSSSIHIDGLIVERDKLTAIEVKYFRKSFGRQPMKSIANISAALKNTEVPLIVALVSEGLSKSDRQKYIGKLHEEIENVKGWAQIRAYDFLELKQKYGIEETPNNAIHSDGQGHGT
jgi:hypothetical protein